MSERRLRILVSGMIAEDPHQGGATWAVLQHLIGLQRLGHDVRFVEPVRKSKLVPAGVSLARSRNAQYFHDVMRAFHLADIGALLLTGTFETCGLSYNTLRQWSRGADLLVNVSGMLTDETLLSAIATRVYLDLDPAFNQLWHATQGIDMRLDAHTHFVTVGLTIGTPACDIPTCDRAWIPTFPPVVLCKWPVANGIGLDAFTTVGNWRGYGAIQHEGRTYGQKVHAFRQVMKLPTLTAEKFVVALSIHQDETADLQALAANGWTLVDPAAVAATPAAYREFVRGSKAEIGIPKSGYVVSQSGWFSDRSACYLASGRPVVAQETGFSQFLPTGKGLLAFQNTADAVQAVRAVAADYPRHARAARAIAVEYLDSDKILMRLLDRIEAGA